MRPAAFHGEQWTVLLVWFWNVLDCGFSVALYEDAPAQTFFLRGISLLVEHKCDDLAPAVWVSVCFAAAAVLAECAVHFLPMARSLWYAAAAPT